MRKTWYPNYKAYSCSPQEELLWWDIVIYPVFQISTKSQNDRNYHIAMKHSAPKPDLTFNCKHCYQKFPGFYALLQHKDIQNCCPINRANVEPENSFNDVDDAVIQEELDSCQHFLADSEPERVIHKIFNYAMENLIETVVDEKVDHFSTI